MSDFCALPRDWPVSEVLRVPAKKRVAASATLPSIFAWQSGTLDSLTHDPECPALWRLPYGTKEYTCHTCMPMISCLQQRAGQPWLSAATRAS